MNPPHRYIVIAIAAAMSLGRAMGVNTLNGGAVINSSTRGVNSLMVEVRGNPDEPGQNIELEHEANGPTGTPGAPMDRFPSRTLWLMGVMILTSGTLIFVARRKENQKLE